MDYLGLVEIEAELSHRGVRFTRRYELQVGELLGAGSAHRWTFRVGSELVAKGKTLTELEQQVIQWWGGYNP